MGKFSFKTGKYGDFYFNLKADNGQIVLVSQGYSTKNACDNGIDSVRKNSSDDTFFDRNVASHGQHYFTLKAANGQVIGTREMYTTNEAMENDMASVGQNTPEATIETSK
jgi:uncharacterized protein YegP (UPF0339 family)